MSALKDISNGIIRKALGNSALVKGVIAINAGGAATIKTSGAINYTVDGVYYTKNQLAAQSIVVTHDRDGNPVSAAGPTLPAYVQPAGTTVYYLLCLDKGQNLAVVQGSYDGQPGMYPDLQRAINGQSKLPQEPVNFVAFGLMKVVTTNGATFTPGTTALDAANVAVTYFDLEYVPSIEP